MALSRQSTRPADSVTLKQAARHHRVLIGTAVAARFLTEPDYPNVVVQEFSQIEPENEMKFESLHPRPDTDPQPYNFKDADVIADFASAHKLKLRGHCLVWHSQVARWVRASKFSPKAQSKTLSDHIHTVVARYAGKVYAWDVVNEAFEGDGSLRHSPWYDQPGIGLANQGTAYIEQAFRWARQADHRAKLYYNDYDSEVINPKSDAIYAMAKDFKARKVPMTGVGFQMHLNLGSDHPEKLESIRQNLHRFTQLGLDIQITELDVSLPDNKPETLQKQAHLYNEIFKICLAEPRCTAIQIWGFTDKHSWIPQFSRGKAGWALLFDETYQKKPAYFSVIDALSSTDSANTSHS